MKRLVTKDGPPTVQQLPISQDYIKVMRSIPSPADQIELACLISQTIRPGSRDRLGIAKTAADAATARCH